MRGHRNIAAVVSPLDLKLLRDLRHMKGQVATIALVVAAGIAVFIAMSSVFRSLQSSRDRYYDAYRFADVFADLERAPESVRLRLEQVPGIASIETRVQAPVRLAGGPAIQPPVGQLVSLPDHGSPILNTLHLTAGRLPEPNRAREAVLLDRFAGAQGVRPGDTLRVILNGAEVPLTVVGIAMSPEFIYPAAAGAFVADEKSFAVLWMRRAALAPMLERVGAFNNVTARLQPGADPRAAVAEFERILERYGATRVVPREDQISNQILDGELTQLEGMATTLPLIFLFVAAFLLNVVLSRVVGLQRPEIAALKAVGYSNREISAHFLKLVVLIVALGAVAGAGLGYWFGYSLNALYAKFFQFPGNVFRIEARTILTATALSLVSGCAGALLAIRAVVRLPAAEAMRPPAPLTYRHGAVERALGTAALPASLRMISRELLRRPVRTAMTVFGVALATAVLILGRFNADAISKMVVVLFEELDHSDLTAAFMRPVPPSALRRVELIPGVDAVEGVRTVAARVHHGHRFRDVALNGYPDDLTLRTVRDSRGRIRTPPDDGALITEQLAKVLDVEVGDVLEVELREGQRERLTIPVSAVVDELLGMQLHVRLGVLAHALGERPTVSMASIRLASGDEAAVSAALQELPLVVAVSSRRQGRETFLTHSAESVNLMTTFATLFAVVLAIGVVYNNARIALSLRERELASMRVLGFTRREISRILVGELMIQVVLAVPLGFALAWPLMKMIASSIDPEQFRLPLWVSPRSYVFAAAVTLASGAVSAWWVRRRLDHLDLIAVLKERE